MFGARWQAMIAALILAIAMGTGTAKRRRGIRRPLARILSRRACPSTTFATATDGVRATCQTAGSVYNLIMLSGFRVMSVSSSQSVLHCQYTLAEVKSCEM